MHMNTIVINTKCIWTDDDQHNNIGNVINMANVEMYLIFSAITIMLAEIAMPKSNIFDISRCIVSKNDFLIIYTLYFAY